MRGSSSTTTFVDCSFFPAATFTVYSPGSTRSAALEAAEAAALFAGLLRRRLGHAAAGGRAGSRGLRLARRFVDGTRAQVPRHAIDAGVAGAVDVANDLAVFVR